MARREQLFDVVHDPTEQTDLAATMPSQRESPLELRSVVTCPLMCGAAARRRNSVGVRRRSQTCAPAFSSSSNATLATASLEIVR